MTTKGLALAALAALGCGDEATSISVTRQALSAPGLVAAYGLNEGTGTTVLDASGNGHTGTFSAPKWIAGKFGSALDFRGGYVTIPTEAGFNLTKGMTLSAWVYPLNHNGYQTVVMKERPGGFAYGLYANGATSRAPGAGFTSGGTSNERWLESTTVLPTLTWSYLAATYDGARLSIFVNGTQVASQAETLPIDTTTGAIRIGGNAVWGEAFLGAIDEVRIYNRALSASELVADMNTPVGAGAPGTGAAGTGGAGAGGAGSGGAGAGGAGSGGAGAGGTGGAPASDVFPLRLAPGQRYLVDQAGRPFMIVGDSPWEIVTMLSNADAATYMDDRVAKGFNTFLIELFEHTTASAFGVADQAGNRPFATALPGSTYPDFSVPNDAYFDHVEQIVSLALSRGVLVLFTPAYLGYKGGAEGWYQEMTANGVARLTAFGNYVGRRFARYPNIMWVDGGDYNPPNKTLTRAVANGIKAFDPQHLHTVHAADGTSGLDYWPGESWLDVDTVYDDIGITNVAIYVRARTEYTRADWKPFFLIEACYEAGNCGGEVLIRQQAYETLLTGGFGQIYGRAGLWEFGANWRTLLNSQGANDMSRVKALFTARRWDKLIPDVDQTFLTAGAGTGGTHASAAYASDGTFALVYTPAIRDLTINMGRLSGAVSARWYDPTNGTFFAAAATPLPNSGSYTFRPTRNNARGTTDWVLLLER